MGREKWGKGQTPPTNRRKSGKNLGKTLHHQKSLNEPKNYWEMGSMPVNLYLSFLVMDYASHSIIIFFPENFRKQFLYFSYLV